MITKKEIQLKVNETESLDKLIVNLNYEYEDSDMLGILRVKLRVINSSAIFIPNYPVGTHGISLKQYLQEEQVEHATFGKRVLLIPYNVGGYHWVGVVINIDHDNSIDEFWIIDSIKTKSHITNVQEVIREAVQICPDLRQKLKEKLGWIQEDTVSCGPLTIENLFSAVSRTVLIPKIVSKQELITIRLEHIDAYRTYNQDFYQRQKHNINRVASLQKQHKWLAEAGTHFNVYELQSISRIIKLIQGVKGRELRECIIAALQHAKEEKHKQHLDRVRDVLNKANNVILEPDDRKSMFEILNELFDIDSKEINKSLDLNNFKFKLPYEAINFIVKGTGVNSDELSSTQISIQKQIEADEKSARSLQERLWKEKDPEVSRANQQKFSYRSIIKNVANRIFKSNNRSLGTVFGCFGG